MSRSTEEQDSTKSRGRPEGLPKRWSAQRKAKDALGDDFDLRRFHETVPRPGSLPMTVLESHIDRFIEEERAVAAS